MYSSKARILSICTDSAFFFSQLFGGNDGRTSGRLLGPSRQDSMSSNSASMWSSRRLKSEYRYQMHQRCEGLHDKPILRVLLAERVACHAGLVNLQAEPIRVKAPANKLASSPQIGVETLYACAFEGSADLARLLVLHFVVLRPRKGVGNGGDKLLLLSAVVIDVGSNPFDGGFGASFPRPGRFVGVSGPCSRSPR